MRHFYDINSISKVNQESEASFQAEPGQTRRKKKLGLFRVEILPSIQTEISYGREAEIQKIHQYVGTRDIQRLRTCLIYGRRGVGKTQIALEYVRRYREKFDAISRIEFGTSASLRQSITDTAVALELPGADKTGHFEENLMQILHWLKTT